MSVLKKLRKELKKQPFNGLAKSIEYRMYDGIPVGNLNDIIYNLNAGIVTDTYLKTINKNTTDKKITITNQNDVATEFPYVDTYLATINKDTVNNKITITDQAGTTTEFPYGSATPVVELTGTSGTMTEAQYNTINNNDFVVIKRTASATDSSISYYTKASSATVLGVYTILCKSYGTHSTDQIQINSDYTWTRMNIDYLNNTTLTGTTNADNVTVAGDLTVPKEGDVDFSQADSVELGSNAEADTSIKVKDESVYTTYNYNGITYSPDGTNTRTFAWPSTSGTIALLSDIPAVSGWVTIDTAQTITGEKTFSTTPIMNAISRKFNNITWTLTLPQASGTIALQSDVDTKVSQAGDTMRGGLSFDFDDAPSIYATDNDIQVQICGGDRDDRAATITAYGGAHASKAGQVEIIANNGTNASTYTMTPGTADKTRYVGGLSTDVDLNTLLPMEKEAGTDTTNINRAKIFQNQWAIPAGTSKTLTVGRTGMIFFKRGSSAYCGFWTTWDSSLTELVNTVGSGTFSVSFTPSSNTLTVTNNSASDTASMVGMVITTN